jgi:hypothetical protein
MKEKRDLTACVAFTTGAVVFLCYKTAQTGLTP